MARIVALVVSLCLLQVFVSCAPPKEILIDTPEKYENLKQGLYDEEYRIFHVTSGAHPQVLLQPSHFENSSYLVMTFESLAEEGNNKISIFPGKFTRAEVSYRDGVNPFSGVPKNYKEYDISYQYPATPSNENVDSIFQWKSAIRLNIYDQENVVISLLKRIDEFSKLEKLWKLTLSIQDENYKQVNVAAFIENLRSLEEISFYTYHMNDRHIKEFLENNKVPSSWKGFISGKVVIFRKQK